jgi:hypothetical protein
MTRLRQGYAWQARARQNDALQAGLTTLCSEQKSKS